MIDMTMVKRVARAIATSVWQTRGGAEEKAFDAYDLTNNNGRFEYDCAARAAIAAMEEPTKGMVDAGYDRAENSGVRYAYRAMIQAALNEQG